MDGTMYPNVPNYSPEQRTLDQLNKARIDEMKLQLEILKKDEGRYRKLVRRWKNTANALTYTSIVLVGITGLASGIILIPALAVPLLIPIILAPSGSLGVAFLEGINKKLCSTSIDKLEKKSALVKSYIDKIYYYTQKAYNDGIITVEEIEGFHKILDEYREAIKGMGDGQMPSIDKKLQKKAQLQADKEANEIFLQQMKEEFLRSRLNGNGGRSGN